MCADVELARFLFSIFQLCTNNLSIDYLSTIYIIVSTHPNNMSYSAADIESPFFTKSVQEYSLADIESPFTPRHQRRDGQSDSSSDFEEEEEEEEEDDDEDEDEDNYYDDEEEYCEEEEYEEEDDEENLTPAAVRRVKRE
jgi:hypothetical protein